MNDLANKDMKFGYSAGVPDEITDGWGARLILNRGEIDMLRDRQGYFGNSKIANDFCAHLNSVTAKWTANVKTLYYSGEIDPSKQNHVTIYEDEKIKLVGNTNGSFGYLYVAGWFK